MKLLIWAFRLLVFLFLVAFAIQNTDPVVLRFLPGSAWESPLVMVLLAAFVVGIVLGATSLLGVIYRQRREISRLKRLAVQANTASTEVPPVV